MTSRGSKALTHSFPRKAMPMSIKMKVYRPVIKMGRMTKQVDDTLQVIALNSDVVQLILHNIYTTKAHFALEVMQTDMGVVSKTILALKIARLVYDAIFRAYKKKQIRGSDVAGGTFVSVALCIISYLIFADNCSTQKST